MNNRYSKAAFIACSAFLFLAGICYYPKWKQPATEATLSWDVSGYYFYLPAAFIYGDVRRLGFADSVIAKYQPTPDLQQAYRHVSGNYVMKYTMGQAILYAPFFFAGHLYAGLSSYPADGFSYPYQLAIGLGMLLYACAGLYFLRKVLLCYFPDKVVAVTVTVIASGTNYLNYTAVDGAMTHNTLFTWYAVLLYCTIRFYRRPALKIAMITGFCAGLITLIRPTEIICVVIPLLWGMGAGGIYQRLQLFRKQYLYYLSAAIVFLLVLCCQFLYWKWSTGEWIVYTYRQEGFDWLHPHIKDGMFSYKAGWFTYTPVMLLVIPGLVCLFQKKKILFPAMALFIGLFVYTCFSWKEWWYGAGVGQRAMIQLYPLLGFPLASFFERVSQGRFVKMITVSFIITCTWYNLWLTHQAHRGGLLKAGEMTSAYFWEILGKYKVPPQTAGLLDNPEKFRGDTAGVLAAFQLPVFRQELGRDSQWSRQYFFQIPPRANWVRAEFILSTPQKEWDIWKMPQAIIRFYQSDTTVKTSFVRVSRVLSEGESRYVTVDSKVPVGYDSAGAFLWNAGSDKRIMLHGITVKMYQVSISKE